MAGNVDATASLSEADVAAIRADFPILGREVGGHPLTYLDSANTSQKPQVVIDAIAEHYGQHNANVARAMHRLGLEATQAFEGGRERIAQFLGASRPEEVVALSNASEALNLAANTLGTRLGPRDEVVITIMEHHSNLVPWQLVCERTGAKLRWFDITDDGQLDLDKAEREGLINEHTKVVSLALASNVLGTINPVQRIAQWAHQVGAVVVVDASQAVPQMPVDVTELGVDLLAFTGHKMLGPTGIGVLWAKNTTLNAMPPFLTGGSMIEIVRLEGSTYAPAPQRFEAGTPNAAQAIGLAAACDYLDALGMANVFAHEQDLITYALEGFAARPWTTVLGPLDAASRTGAVAFTVDEVHPHDVGQIVDDAGVAIRTGHHCAWPLHRRLKAVASSRISFNVYSTREDIDAFFAALDRVPSIFGLEV